MKPAFPKHSYIILAAAYAILGEKEKAIEYLNDIDFYSSYWGLNRYIDLYPPFENIRNEPEVIDIRKRISDKNKYYQETNSETGETGRVEPMILHHYW
jgi:hypothetical protein